MGRAGDGAIVLPVGQAMPSVPRISFSHGRSQRYTGLLGIPDMVMEIASTSGIETDRTIKGLAYARVGIPEYWLLDPDGPSYSLLIYCLNRETSSYPTLTGTANAWVYSPLFRREFQLLCLPCVDARLPYYELRSRKRP